MNTFRRLAAWVTCTAIASGGCMAVPVSPDGGFPALASLVKERTGHEIARDADSPEDRPAVEGVRGLLEGGLTDQGAVRIALLNNRELQALYSDLGVSQSDLVQASLLHNPVADVAAGFPVGGGIVDLNFTLAMDVVDLFYVPLRKRVAEAELEETRMRLAGEVLDLVWRTQTAFYRHQANEQTIELLRQVSLSTAAGLELTRRMREAGNVTELQLATEQVLTEEARLELRAAEIAASESREELNRLMGLWGRDAAWKIASDRLPDAPIEPIAVAGLERRAVERSLDLAMAERRIVAAGEQLGLNRSSALFPEILVGGTGERQTETGNEWDAGPSLALPLPVFDRGQARVARARAELRRAREGYHALGVRIRSLTRETRDRVVGHGERALYYRRAFLPLLERVVHEAQLQYGAMQVAPFDLLRAKEQQIQAGVRYVQTLREYWLARADLGAILAGRLPPLDRAAEPGATIDTPRRSPIPTLN